VYVDLAATLFSKSNRSTFCALLEKRSSSDAIRSNFFPKATLLDSTNFCYSFTLAQQLKLHQIAKHQISGMSLEAREEKASLKAWVSTSCCTFQHWQQLHRQVPFLSS